MKEILNSGLMTKKKPVAKVKCKAASWLWSWTLRIALKKRKTEGGTQSRWGRMQDPQVNANSIINVELSFKFL